MRHDSVVINTCVNAVVGIFLLFSNAYYAIFAPYVFPSYQKFPSRDTPVSELDLC